MKKLFSLSLAIFASGLVYSSSFNQKFYVGGPMPKVPRLIKKSRMDLQSWMHPDGENKGVTVSMDLDGDGNKEFAVSYHSCVNKIEIEDIKPFSIFDRKNDRTLYLDNNPNDGHIDSILKYVQRRKIKQDVPECPIEKLLLPKKLFV